MADMDQGVKRLLQAHPADIIQLALPGAEYLAPIETDVATEPQLVLDTLFRIRYEGEECGVNVEIQGYPDPMLRTLMPHLATEPLEQLQARLQQSRPDPGPDATTPPTSVE